MIFLCIPEKIYTISQTLQIYNFNLFYPKILNCSIYGKWQRKKENDILMGRAQEWSWATWPGPPGSGDSSSSAPSPFHPRRRAAPPPLRLAPADGEARARRPRERRGEEGEEVYEMVWALTPVDTVRGAPPTPSLRRRCLSKVSRRWLVGWLSAFFGFFAGAQRCYIFAAGTYKVGRKGPSLSSPPWVSCAV